jgi:hypothetical protein
MPINLQLQTKKHEVSSRGSIKTIKNLKCITIMACSNNEQSE